MQGKKFSIISAWLAGLIFFGCAIRVWAEEPEIYTNSLGLEFVLKIRFVSVDRRRLRLRNFFRNNFFFYRVCVNTVINF